MLSFRHQQHYVEFARLLVMLIVYYFYPSQAYGFGGSEIQRISILLKPISGTCSRKTVVNSFRELAHLRKYRTHITACHQFNVTN
jgi:hypothetical protein